MGAIDNIESTNINNSKKNDAWYRFRTPKAGVGKSSNPMSLIPLGHQSIWQYHDVLIIISKSKLNFFL